jgi:hypothetical protein
MSSRGQAEQHMESEMADSYPILSTYQFLQIPESMVTLAVSIAVATLVAALFLQKIYLFGKWIDLTNKGKFVIMVLSASFILMLFPAWPNTELLRERAPYCNLSYKNAETKNTVVFWFSESDTNSYAELSTGTSPYSPVTGTGEIDVFWEDQQVSQIFRLRVSNRYDYCLRETRVWNPKIVNARSLDCSLVAEPSEVKENEEFRLTWLVSEQEDLHVFINGAEVENYGHANFTFNGPNYDRFRLVAQSATGICEAETMILATAE